MKMMITDIESMSNAPYMKERVADKNLVNFLHKMYVNSGVFKAYKTNSNNVKLVECVGVEHSSSYINCHLSVIEQYDSGLYKVRLLNEGYLFTFTFEEVSVTSDLSTDESSTIGYHKTKIKKGINGEISKIQEELDELKDAEQQDIKVMQLAELSDLIGAIELYLENKFPDISLDDIVKMKDATKRAFQTGRRS